MLLYFNYIAFCCSFLKKKSKYLKKIKNKNFRGLHSGVYIGIYPQLLRPCSWFLFDTLQCLVDLLHYVTQMASIVAFLAGLISVLLIRPCRGLWYLIASCTLTVYRCYSLIVTNHVFVICFNKFTNLLTYLLWIFCMVYQMLEYCLLRCVHYSLRSQVACVSFRWPTEITFHLAKVNEQKVSVLRINILFRLTNRTQSLPKAPSPPC